MPRLTSACDSLAPAWNVMTSRVRKFLFVSFVVLFFLLAAVILPYAFGFELNFSGMKLQRTGMFDIKTTPSGAVIYLNGKKQTSWLGQLSGRDMAATTPLKLKNVTPGTYQVRLELAGYWPWTKQLVVSPGATTYLEDVYFFKKIQPTLLAPLAAEEINAVAVAPDHKYAAVLTKTALQIFSLDKAQPPQVITVPQNTASVLSWSPSQQKIAAGRLIIDRRDQSLVNLKDFGIGAINRLAWASDDLIYFQTDNQIKSLDLKNSKLVVADFPKNVIDFKINNGYLYLIYDGNQPRLSIVKLNDNQFKESAAIKLKDYERYRFIDLGAGNINLQEVASKKLYTLSNKFPWLNDYAVKEIGALTVGQWVGSDKLIFGNNFELSLWTSDADRAKLLTRISHPITALAWHKSNNYVIFATDTSINTLELDDRYTYNISTLLESSKIVYPIFNRDGSGVLFWTKLDQKGGFYFLEI